MRQTPLCYAGAVNPKDLGEARLFAHYAIQWLARITRAYLPAEKDDSHTSLSWIPGDHVFLTQYLPNGVAFGLMLSELTLFYTGQNGAHEELALDGKTDDETGQWVSEIIGKMGLNVDRLHDPSPYALPYHALQNEGTYDCIDTAMALRELSLWYNYAFDMLSLIIEENEKKFLKISNVQVWPHHFDIATSMHLKTDHPQVQPTIGVGLSPGDEYYDQPYFYVSPWPYLKPQMLPELPFIGQWHIKGFVGAVALSSRLCGLDNRDKALVTFLRDAVNIGQQRQVI